VTAEGSALDGCIAMLEQELLAWIDDVVRHVDIEVGYYWQPGWEALREPDNALGVRLAAAVEHLTGHWPASELGGLASAMYFHPDRWQPSYTRNSYRVRAMIQVLESCLVTHPPPDVHDHLSARLAHILSRPYDGADMPLSRSWPPDHFYQPEIESCLGLLLALPPSPANLDLCERVIGGALDTVSDLTPYFRGDHWARMPSYRTFSQQLFRFAPRIMDRLFEHGRLDYDLFRQALERLPSLTGAAAAVTTRFGFTSLFHSQVGVGLSVTALDWCRSLGMEVAETLTAETVPLLLEFEQLAGSRCLVLSARYHHNRGLDVLKPRAFPFHPGWSDAVMHLAWARDIEPPDEEASARLVAELRTFPPATLRRLLPVTRHGRRVLCEALGWEDRLPLIDLLLRLEPVMNCSLLR
jgi:hypothetical protein